MCVELTTVTLCACVCLSTGVSVHMCVVKPDGRGGGEIKTCMCIYVAKSCGGVCICERERKKT